MSNNNISATTFTHVQDIISSVVGEPCSRMKVGEYKSLWLGFGKLVPHEGIRGVKEYGEWELGTYECAWRILKQDLVLLGSSDPDSTAVLDTKLSQIQLGKFKSIEQPTNLDVRITFDTGITVDFLADVSDNEGYFHIFAPEKKSIELSCSHGWRIGSSDKPWK